MKYSELVSQIKNNQLNISNISIKRYLPLNVKYMLANALAVNILDQNENDVYYINPLKRQMVLDFLLLKYTDIEKEDNKYDVEDYDLLRDYGFYQLLKKKVIENTDDYNLLEQALDVSANVLINQSEVNENGITAILRKTINNGIDKLVATYSTTEGRKNIRGFLKDLNSNAELLDTVNAVIGRVGLEEAKELIEKKFKELQAEKRKTKTSEKAKESSKKVEKEE